MAKVNNEYSSKKLPVKELFKFTPIELKTGLKNNLNILFEDDVAISLHYKEVVLLRFIMDMYKPIPKVKIVSRHCFTHFYSNGILTSKTINKAFEVILEDTVNVYVKPTLDRTILPELYKLMYRITNDIYNDLVYDELDYVNSINVFDLLDIQMYPELLESMREVNRKKDYLSVNNTYAVLDKLLRTTPEIKDNIITKGYISGTVNANQVKQLLASRGYVTEIDSNIFKYPIASSFTLGMSNIYDITIESRAGAKALALSNKAVQQSEYLARELQLITMIVEKLVDTDCGSTDYMDWYVKGKEDGGKSDIDNMLGKYFFNPETDKEEVITSRHKYLEGKTIKLRTAINCRLEDPTCICIKCFGDLAYTIPKHSNIGHFSSTEITQKLTQSILSTKHLATSATSGETTLDPISEKLFMFRNSSYVFKAHVLDKVKTKYTLVVDQFSGFGIKDLNKNVNVYKLNPARVSRIMSIQIIAQHDNGKVDVFPIQIQQGKRYGHFTYDFLQYVVDNGFTLDDMDRINVDLSKWDYKKPLITMPELEYNYVALAQNVKSIFRTLEMNGKESTKKSLETPESLLQKLFDLINTKLDVNLALMEVVMYAITVYDLENDNYHLGRNSPNRSLVKSRQLIANRSLGAGYDWEDVVNNILNPKSYYGFNDVSHPLDVMIKPNEVLGYNK